MADPGSPMTVEGLRSDWAGGSATLGGWVVGSDPLIAEHLARCGFDEVTIDLQHGTSDFRDIALLCAAITRGGAVPLVRVPRAEPVTIGRCLDLGAAGVIVAMVGSAEEAAATVDACRYAPEGSRSIGPVRAQWTMDSGPLSDPLATERLAAVVCMPMVETADGLANVAEIAATPGIDGVYVGPGDLALAMGLPLPGGRTAEQQQRLDVAIDSVVAACDAAGVTAGIQGVGGASAAAWVRRGFRMVTVTADVSLVAGGRRELEVARSASS